MDYIAIGLFIFAAVILLFVLLIRSSRHGSLYWPDADEIEIREVGKRGEKYATKVIESVLRDDDFLFTNVAVTYEGKKTELDNVVVNKCGVFIIEVKRYNGVLYGSNDDYEWTKAHESSAGNMYYKQVKNPIKQVKRQVYILSKYLDYYGAKVWVDGYAIILGAKSPIESEYILRRPEDIDRTIHSAKKNHLTNKVVDQI